MFMEGEIENIFEVSSSMKSASSTSSSICKRNFIPSDLFENLYYEVSKNSFNSYESEFKRPKLAIDTILESRHMKPHGLNVKKNTGNQMIDITKFDNLPDTDSVEAILHSTCRLKKIKSLLENSKSLSSDILKQNLDYFINVFDMSLKGLKNFDEPEISDYFSDTDTIVPGEVVKWLSTTFTRVSHAKKIRSTRFKSVAHAIRAGIMVDRMFRRMSSIIHPHFDPYVSEFLKRIDEWNFEIFKFDELTERNSLRHVAHNLFERYSLMSKFKISISQMHIFMDRMVFGYEMYENPYHNSIHAADVLQTTFNILSNSGLINWLNDLEIFAVFFAAIIHDFEHTGTTNNFHIQSRSDLAYVYNDRSVLENYHLSASFRILNSQDCNILHDLSFENFKEFRQLVIEIVLATDMSFHFAQLKNMKNLMSLGDTIDKTKSLSLIVHCADISHPTKQWSLHESWTNRLIKEYFAQGDKEKQLGLPFSPLCDREKTPVAQSQIGFINFIVDPSFVLMGDMIEKIFEQILHEDSRRESNSDISDIMKLEIKPKPISRPWAEFLLSNKTEWQRRADSSVTQQEK